MKKLLIASTICAIAFSGYLPAKEQQELIDTQTTIESPAPERTETEKTVVKEPRFTEKTNRKNHREEMEKKLTEIETTIEKVTDAETKAALKSIHDYLKTMHNFRSQNRNFRKDGYKGKGRGENKRERRKRNDRRGPDSSR